jgi:hypothetical protein
VLGWTVVDKTILSFLCWVGPRLPNVCSAALGVLYSEDCKTYKTYKMEFSAPSFTSNAFITAK